MKHFNIPHILFAAAIFIIMSVLGLWSWNTLASLFDGSQAQYKHVIAAAVALLVFRWGLLQGGFPRKSGRIGRDVYDRNCRRADSCQIDTGSAPATAPDAVQP